VFRQLNREDVSSILDIELAKVTARLEAKGQKLSLTKTARNFLIDNGFSASMGARPLRRAIERYIEDPLAEDILRGKFEGTKTIEVVARKDQLVFRTKGSRKKQPAKASSNAD